MFALYLPLLLSVFYLVDRTVLPKLYIFDPATLQELCRQSIELYGGERGNTTLLFEDLTDRLQGVYGRKYVQDLNHGEWFFNNAGGAMVSFFLLLLFVVVGGCCWWWWCRRGEKEGRKKGRVNAIVVDAVL